MSKPTFTQAEALMKALQALIDAVKEGGEHGAPGGVMYAALMGAMSLKQFESCMTALVNRGHLRREGDLYFFVKDLMGPQ